MKTSVEISYYPLNEEYKTPIEKFIASLQAYDKIVVKPNNISTHLFGEYDDVMAALTACMKRAMELPHSIFILKMLNSDRS